MSIEEQHASWAKFRHAVDLKRMGVASNKTPYIRDVRAKHGDEVAEQARRELVRFARSAFTTDEQPKRIKVPA